MENDEWKIEPGFQYKSCTDHLKASLCKLCKKKCFCNCNCFDVRHFALSSPLHNI